MSIPQIAAFPKGDGLWRVDWFGGIAFPDRLIRRTQPSVFVHLSRVIDPTVLADPTAPITASSTLPWQKQFKCWVSVGSTMLLRIGEVPRLSEQARVERNAARGRWHRARRSQGRDCGRRFGCG